MVGSCDLLVVYGLLVCAFVIWVLVGWVVCSGFGFWFMYSGFSFLWYVHVGCSLGGFAGVLLVVGLWFWLVLCL